MVFLLTSVISSCSEDFLWVVVDDGSSSYNDEDDSIGFVMLYECVFAADEEEDAAAAPALEEDATDAVAEYEVDEDTLVFVWL